MKLKQLEQELQQVTVFKNPKIHLEQYPTTPHLASLLIFTAYQNGDIEDKIVIDLGIGTGMLTCASLMMDSSYNIGIDVDTEALEQAVENCNEFGQVELINANLTSLNLIKIKGDTVIMNPPFGTKLKGIDVEFLTAATKMAKVVYSLHKTSTRDFILKKALQLGFRGTVLAELKYDLPKSYQFHKKHNVVVRVDFIRFEKI